MIDFCISPHINGLYDLHVKNGNIEETDTFLTAILMTLYGEQRALQSEVLAPENRRGWWGDLLNTSGHQQGSKLWFLTQTRSTDNLLLFLTSHLEERLKANFLSDNFVRNVEVTGTRNSDIIRMNIRFLLNDNVEAVVYNAWLNLETSQCLLVQRGQLFTILFTNPAFENEDELTFLVDKKDPVEDDFKKLLLLALPSGQFTYIAASSTIGEAIAGSGEHDILSGNIVPSFEENFYLVTEGSNNIISYE
jgi:phage gp46-like protein